MRRARHVDHGFRVLAEDIPEALGLDPVGIDLARDRLGLDRDDQPDVLAPRHGERGAFVDPGLTVPHGPGLEAEAVRSTAERGAIVEDREAFGIVEDLLEIGQRPHRGIQRVQELLGVGGEVGQREMSSVRAISARQCSKKGHHSHR